MWELKIEYTRRDVRGDRIYSVINHYKKDEHDTLLCLKRLLQREIYRTTHKNENIITNLIEKDYIVKDRKSNNWRIPKKHIDWFALRDIHSITFRERNIDISCWAYSAREIFVEEEYSTEEEDENFIKKVKVDSEEIKQETT